MATDYEIKDNVLKLSSRYPLRIGLISDEHFGAVAAIMGESFENSEGQTTLPNDAQKIINRQWVKVVNLFKKYKVNYILNIGDIICGLNPIERGRGVFLTDESDQIDLAVQNLQCYKDIPQFIFSGTGYHGLKGIKVLRELTRSLNAEFLGAHAYIELTVKDRTRRLFVAHEAAGALVYPATLMSRDINWALEAEAMGTTLPIDGIIRAHLHTWLHVDHSGKHAVQLPCWQAHVPYKSTIKYYFKLQPTIGGTMLLVDEHGRLDFWGGSPPFCLNKEERLRLNIARTKIRGLDNTKVFKCKFPCPKCEETIEIQKSGFKITRKGRKQRYQCRSCGFKYVPVI